MTKKSIISKKEIHNIINECLNELEINEFNPAAPSVPSINTVKKEIEQLEKATNIKLKSKTINSISINGNNVPVDFLSPQVTETVHANDKGKVVSYLRSLARVEQTTKASFPAGSYFLAGHGLNDIATVIKTDKGVWEIDPN